MPEARQIVVNTGPIIALVAATGSLEVLRSLYSVVHIPHEVEREVLANNASLPSAAEFLAASWLTRSPVPTTLSPFLRNSLDAGEAGVIQTALNLRISTVCIDEAVGRRIARLSGLTVTGSIGILVKAAQHGYPVNPVAAIERMRSQGVWVSDRVLDELKTGRQ